MPKSKRKPKQGPDQFNVKLTQAEIAPKQWLTILDLNYLIKLGAELYALDEEYVTRIVTCADPTTLEPRWHCDREKLLAKLEEYKKTSIDTFDPISSSIDKDGDPFKRKRPSEYKIVGDPKDRELIDLLMSSLAEVKEDRDYYLKVFKEYGRHTKDCRADYCSCGLNVVLRNISAHLSYGQ